jgi:aspartate aminotransferase
MFSSPCNPTGAVYSKTELAALANVFASHENIAIISDEIYEHINYVGAHESIAQFENIRSRVIIINGLSKAYAMTGWRLGYLAADASLVKACEKLQGQFTSATCSITQRASIAALTGTQEPAEKMIEKFKQRRHAVENLLAQIPNISYVIPDGAFYVFPNISAYFGKTTPNGALIETADDLCLYLLNDAHVSVVTGKAFGEPNCLRMSFANSTANIEKGLAKIKDALAGLS